MAPFIDVCSSRCHQLHAPCAFYDRSRSNFSFCSGQLPSAGWQLPELLRRLAFEVTHDTHAEMMRLRMLTTLGS